MIRRGGRVHTQRCRGERPVVHGDRLEALLEGEEASSSYFGSYLVDPASNYMLVLKIKPCKCKYGPSFMGARLRTAH